MVEVHFSLKANQFLVMVLNVYLKIFLIVLFYVIDFLNNFILADELFAKALRSLEAYVLVNNNLCGKLYPSIKLPITFDERFKVTSVPFFIPNFNLLSCELGKFTFKVLYLVILHGLF